ncbi:MAG: response regulator transcription factor [Armatimonadetes bacterium]|nr:response regulator transcription factor [Armatimonadota bacterium]
MKELAHGTLHLEHEQTRAERRKRIVIASNDRAFAESLRSHLAVEFDVLLARNGGEAAAKAQAVSVDVAIVDLGCPILGISALARLRDLTPMPVICALVMPSASSAQSQFDFDYVLARPKTGADLPDRIRFILARSASDER